MAQESLKRHLIKFGLRSADADFDSRTDLDGDGAIAFSDFLIFANAFGQTA